MPESYAFIYDEALNERRHERVLAETEARLTTLGVTGRTIRLAMFRNIKETIEGLVRGGIETVVIVGNDQSLDKAMWFLPDLDVTLGYLPIIGQSRFNKPLGIPDGVGACDILAARRIETIDVGICDGRYFLSEVKIENTVARVDIEGRFSLNSETGGSVVIRNMNVGEGEVSDVQDGWLEVLVRPLDGKAPSRWRRAKLLPETRIPTRFGEIVSPDPVELQVDTHITSGFHFQFSIVPRKLRVIVGRSRHLSGEQEARPEGLPNDPKASTMPSPSLRSLV